MQTCLSGLLVPAADGGAQCRAQLTSRLSSHFLRAQRGTDGQVDEQETLGAVDTGHDSGYSSSEGLLLTNNVILKTFHTESQTSIGHLQSI